MPKWGKFSVSGPKTLVFWYYGFSSSKGQSLQNIPRYLWGEVIQASAFELYRFTSDINNELSTADICNGDNDLSKLKVFGCQALVTKVLEKINSIQRKNYSWLL